VAALEWGAEVEAELTGKPAAGFFAMAARLLGQPPGRLVMVGDDVEVDVAGARAAGLDGWLVRTGKFDAAKLAAAPPDRAPGRVLDSVGDLPHALGLR
jgi:ribonucleotide monophosphatase NagD (HAD superfamily)